MVSKEIRDKVTGICLVLGCHAAYLSHLQAFPDIEGSQRPHVTVRLACLIFRSPELVIKQHEHHVALSVNKGTLMYLAHFRTRNFPLSIKHGPCYAER